MTASIATFALNISSVLAVPVEIEVIGGGYHLRGPSEITFPSSSFSYQESESTVSIRDLSAANYLEIVDENGGNEFNVSIFADNLTCVASIGGQCAIGIDSIANTNLAVRSNDGNSPQIEAMGGSNATYVSLDNAATFVPMNTPATLLSGNGAGPGIWRIFPEIQTTVPGGTKIGTYSGTITILIN